MNKKAKKDGGQGFDAEYEAFQQRGLAYALGADAESLEPEARATRFRELLRSQEPAIRQKVREFTTIEAIVEELKDKDCAEDCGLKRPPPERIVRAAITALVEGGFDVAELDVDDVADKVLEQHPELAAPEAEPLELSEATRELLDKLQLSFQHGTGGVTMSVTAGPYTPPPLVPASPPITDPEDHYVYFHRDIHGQVFYVGMGVGRRAWSRDRHPAWQRYVDTRSDGRFTVEIYRDGLTREEAEGLENEFVAAYGANLVNWINGQRAVDLEKLAEFHRLRDNNRLLISSGRQFEKSDPERAVRIYREAISHMPEYARMQIESGLITELMDPPCWDDSEALDRLTLVLSQTGRHEELLRDAEAYFALYPEARNRCARGTRVQARMEKARTKLQKTTSG